MISHPGLLKVAIKSIHMQKELTKSDWMDLVRQQYQTGAFTESDLVWYYAENIPVISQICLELLQEIRGVHNHNDERKKAF